MNRIYTFKDTMGTEISIDLEQVMGIILPSFLRIPANDRNANIAAVLMGPIKMELSHEQVDGIRIAWMKYINPVGLLN